MKKLFCLICVAAALLQVAALSASAETVRWYTKRVPGHAVPPLEGPLCVISEHRAIYADTKGAEKGEKRIYLTFDAGYENGNVKKVLDTLKEKEVPGAFFILSHLVKSQPDLVRRMKEEGHLICNHTARHPDMAKKDRAGFAKELQDLNSAVEGLLGEGTAPFYRPPEGSFSPDNLKWAEEMGYTTVFWSLCYADWDNSHQPQAAKAKKILSDNIHPGAIVLLHPTSATNAEILGDMIDVWKAQGYDFGTLNEILP